MSTNYKKEVINLIADKTGIEIEEISEASFIEDDLNIGEFELIEILEELEEKFDVELVDMKDDFETVGDILDQLSEKID